MNKKQLEKKLKENIPNKILLVAEAFRKKINIKKIFNLCKIDPWFLEQIKEIVDNEDKIKHEGLPKDFQEFNRIKSIGFSDKKLSELTKTSEDIVRKKRTALKVLPVYKKVDTCCPFPTKNSLMGAGTIGIYEVTFEGSNKNITLYFNIYEKGKILCPKGFSIKKITTTDK